MIIEELSLVFQGPATHLGTLMPSVRRNLACARSTFPQAEIILSTWQMAPAAEKTLQMALDSLDVQVVFSPDPGALSVTAYDITYSTNLNRMLRSASVGLSAVHRPLAIKLRTDTTLNGQHLLELLTRWVLEASGPPRDPAFQIFRGRVVTASWFARDARGSLPYLFHPGDILLAGYTEDVRLFFDAPLADSSLFAPSSQSGAWCAWRYVPEQWCWVHAIQAISGSLPWPGNFSNTPAETAASEQYFLANFVPFRPHQLGLSWPKYWTRYPMRGLFSTVTHRRWCHQIRAYAQGQPNRPYPWPDRVLTALWRSCYQLRARLLLHHSVRRCLVRLFGRR